MDTLGTIGLQGYITEPGEGAAVTVTFFARQNDLNWAYARYSYLEGTVSGEGILSDSSDRSISPLATRMISARENALSEMQKPEHRLCTASPPNTITLPPDEHGMLSVYVMSSTTDTESYPAGGHYRFDFDETGRLIGERRFMNSCFPVDWREKKGAKPKMVFVTHLLDSQPTEVHSFVSRNIPIALIVGTVKNKAIWGIERGHISYIQDIPDR